MLRRLRSWLDTLPVWVEVWGVALLIVVISVALAIWTVDHAQDIRDLFCMGECWR